MPDDGGVDREGHTVDAGHEPDEASSSKKHIVQLKCPQWFSSGKYLQPSNPDNWSEDFSQFADLDGPKRRGRPPKTGSQHPTRPSTRTKLSTLPRPVATRSSKRKLAEVNEQTADQDVEMADAAADAIGQDPTPQTQLVHSRDQSNLASIKDENSDLSASDLHANGDMDRDEPAALTNGHSTPKKNSGKTSNGSTTSPTTRAAARMGSDLLTNHHPLASIEPHEHLDDDEDDDEPVGVLTRAAARSKSAAPNLSASTAPGTGMVLNADESLSSLNETGIEAGSAPGTPKGKGGRWPHGAMKAKAAAAGVSTATFKKSLGKKKGAPGKRKTSDNAEVQACYDRQAQYRSHYKDLKKMLIKSEISYLDRVLDQLNEHPDAYKDTPNYEEVVKFLESRRTTVVANREKEEQLQRQLLDRRFQGDVAITFDIFYGRIKDIAEKYEMKAKRAYVDVFEQAAAEEDDNMTVCEDGEYSSADLDRFNSEQELATEVPTPEDNEPLKKGKPATKPKRGKKRAFDAEAPLVQQIAKRHAPAMLSATTHPEEESEIDKPATLTPALPAGPRGRNKYHFDDHGVFVPTEAKKGPQREEPNNRVVAKPWFRFQKHEIGLRNLYDELNEAKPKPQLPTGFWHFDPHRGVYNTSNSKEDYDERLVEVFGVHPTMGLPCSGSRNPDDAFPHTDYEHVVGRAAPPLRYVDDDHPEPVSTSRSWDVIKIQREWEQFETRAKMDQDFALKRQYGQQSLATFDPLAREYTDGLYVIDDMIDAAKALDRETPKPTARTVSPSPGTRQSARQKARAEAAAAKARPATPVTPLLPPQTPVITSTANLSILADASEYFQNSQMHSPPPPQRHVPAHFYHHSPPAPRTQSQLPHISFINNPMPASDLRPLAPQPHQSQHHALSQPFLQPRPQPIEMQRPYQQPGIMAPPIQPRMPLPYPTMQPHQTHQSSLFYGSHASPPQRPQPLQRPGLRPGQTLRSLLPRTLPGEPPGPPTQHHHINHQQVTFYNPGPPPPPHMVQDHPRFYDRPPQHISPYGNEPYQPYAPGPPGPPPGYGPFRHHSPRR